MPVSVDTTIKITQGTFVQNSVGWLWQALPLVQVFDFNQEVRKTTYDIEPMTNAMQPGGAALEWEPGNTPPEPDFDEQNSVTVHPKGFATKPKVINENATPDIIHRKARDRTNYHLQRAFISLDKACDTGLTNTTPFTSLTFTGTGALDTEASDHVPHKDVNDDLRSLRQFRAVNGLSLEAIMGEEVARILSGYTAYTGAGTGSAIAKAILLDEFALRFAAQHSLDRVHIIRKTTNTAEYGQTASYSREVDFLWMGLLDRRRQPFVAKQGQDTEGPHGAIALAMGAPYMPRISTWTPAGTEVMISNAKWSHDVITPAYTAESLTFGKFYPSSQIFT